MLFLNSFISLLIDDIPFGTGFQNRVSEERKLAFTPVLYPSALINGKIDIEDRVGNLLFPVRS